MDEVSTVHECVTIMFQKLIPDHGVYHHLTSAHGSKFPKSSGLNISFQLSLSPTPDNWQQLIKNTGGNGSSCCAAPVSSINAIEGPHQPPDCKLHHLKGRNQHNLQDYTLRLLFPAILFMVQSPAVCHKLRREEKEPQNSAPQISHQASSSNSFLLTWGIQSYIQMWIPAML